MKHLCLIYSNCQGEGMLHYLKKTAMAERFDFVIFQNYRLILLEESREAFFNAVAQANLILFQPTSDLECIDKFVVPSTSELFAGNGCRRISFPYSFNHGFFPLVKHGEWHTSEYLKERVALAKSKGVLGFAADALFKDFNADRLHYDCALRLVTCLAEQARREEQCEIKLVPFIIKNFKDRRLFLSENHPTSHLFIELAREVVNRTLGHIYWNFLDANGDNEIGLPGELPVHPKVIQELNLHYPATEKAHDFFRGWLEQMVNESHSAS